MEYCLDKESKSKKYWERDGFRYYYRAGVIAIASSGEIVANVATMVHKQFYKQAVIRYCNASLITDVVERESSESVPVFRKRILAAAALRIGPVPIAGVYRYETSRGLLTIEVHDDVLGCIYYKTGGIERQVGTVAPDVVTTLTENSGYFDWDNILGESPPETVLKSTGVYLDGLAGFTLYHLPPITGMDERQFWTEVARLAADAVELTDRDKLLEFTYQDYGLGHLDMVAQVRPTNPVISLISTRGSGPTKVAGVQLQHDGTGAFYDIRFVWPYTMYNSDFRLTYTEDSDPPYGGENVSRIAEVVRAGLTEPGPRQSNKREGTKVKESPMYVLEFNGYEIRAKIQGTGWTREVAVAKVKPCPGYSGYSRVSLLPEFFRLEIGYADCPRNQLLVLQWDLDDLTDEDFPTDVVDSFMAKVKPWVDIMSCLSTELHLGDLVAHLGKGEVYHRDSGKKVATFSEYHELAEELGEHSTFGLAVYTENQGIRIFESSTLDYSVARKANFLSMAEHVSLTRDRGE